MSDLGTHDLPWPTGCVPKQGASSTRTALRDDRKDPIREGLERVDPRLKSLAPHQGGVQCRTQMRACQPLHDVNRRRQMSALGSGLKGRWVPRLIDGKL